MPGRVRLGVMSENTEGVVPDFATEIDQNIGRNLKALREARGMAQSDLARRVAGMGVPGFHQTTIARIESGQRALRASEAIAICRILETTIEGLAESRGSALLRAHGTHLSEKLIAFHQAANELIHARLLAGQEMDRMFPYGPDGKEDGEQLLQSGVDPNLYHMVENRIVDVSPVERLTVAYSSALKDRRRWDSGGPHKGRVEFIRDEMREWVERDG